jgi:hypothetical protein
MPRSGAARRRDAAAEPAGWYPDDLLPQLQKTLGALADVELRYEAARERLGHEAGRTSAEVELEARYRREREPYVQRLEQLQRRIRLLVRSGL